MCVIIFFWKNHEILRCEYFLLTWHWGDLGLEKGKFKKYFWQRFQFWMLAVFSRRVHEMFLTFLIIIQKYFSENVPTQITAWKFNLFNSTFKHKLNKYFHEKFLPFNCKWLSLSFSLIKFSLFFYARSTVISKLPKKEEKFHSI